MSSVRMQRVVWVVVAALGGLMAGCSEVVPTSGPHAVTPPEAVQIYQNPPQKYERLGSIVVTVTPAMVWDENGNADLAFETLKAKASAIGGNGVLLKLKDGGFDRWVGAGYQGKHYLVPMKAEPRTLMAEAIFAIK